MDSATKEMLIRLGIGAFFGGMVGLERQANGRPAGFRTHILVCVASVLLMELSEYYQHLSSIDPEYIRIDPGRIAAGGITGIGFIGAGVIIKMGPNVLGLTTAASLWIISAIGFSVGAGLYVPATAAFAITFFSLLILRIVERMTPGITFKSLIIKATKGIDDEAIKQILSKHHAALYRTDFELNNAEGTVTYYFTISIRRKPAKQRSPIIPLAEELSALEGVRKISIGS